MSNEIKQKKIVKDLFLSDEVLTDVNISSLNLNGDYLPLSGGTINGNLLITNNDSCTIFSPQNSFLQAEVAYSGGTKTYGMSYCGSKGFCILGINLSSDENNNQYIGIKLSGDISTIEEAVLSDIYCEKPISEYDENDDIYPKASKSIPYTHIGKDTMISLSDIMWSIAVKSYSFSSFDSIKTIDTENNIVWFKHSLSELSATYGKNAISLANLSSLSEEELIELFGTDDNLFYAPGFPYIGNTTLNTLYGNTTLGGSSRAIGKYAFASGRDSIADMRYSHAEGTHCAALEIGSHAEGFKCKAKGQYSHAGGYASSTLGNDAFAHGRSCNANKQQSIALGLKATANHDNSFVWSGNEANGSVSNGDKTFNIYTGTGPHDFYINGSNFINCILMSIWNMSLDQKNTLKTILEEPETCTVNIPSNIVDGYTITGATYNTQTGSITVENKIVKQFSAKFSPGKHVESIDKISPTITFKNCIIATQLSFYGDCAASGKPIKITFDNCIFDGSLNHEKQFVYLQYGSKYEVKTDDNGVKTIETVDETAIAQYTIAIKNSSTISKNGITFTHLNPDKDTRALFKGFGSTYDRPDKKAGDHFDINENALAEDILLKNSSTKTLINNIKNAPKAYAPNSKYTYYNFQAGSTSTVTNI